MRSLSHLHFPITSLRSMSCTLAPARTTARMGVQNSCHRMIVVKILQAGLRGTRVDPELDHGCDDKGAGAKLSSAISKFEI